MADWVLDASAVLALMRSEAGAAQVVSALPASLVASVNAAEVVGRLIREGVDADAARLTMIELGCPILPIDAELGLRAGTLAAATATHGLSLGDRCCLALAEREGLTALTADRAWSRLGLPIKIAMIR
jgi:PIN domain nuclease of toxin-antitoxin system